MLITWKCNNLITSFLSCHLRRSEFDAIQIFHIKTKFSPNWTFQVASLSFVCLHRAKCSFSLWSSTRPRSLFDKPWFTVNWSTNTDHSYGWPLIKGGLFCPCVSQPPHNRGWDIVHRLTYCHCVSKRTFNVFSCHSYWRASGAQCRAAAGLLCPQRTSCLWNPCLERRFLFMSGLAPHQTPMS